MKVYTETVLNLEQGKIELSINELETIEQAAKIMDKVKKHVERIAPCDLQDDFRLRDLDSILVGTELKLFLMEYSNKGISVIK